MLHNPFKTFEKKEWVLWLVSLVTVILSNIFCGKITPITFFATSLGITALIFTAKGDVWGQILAVVFSFLYAASSYQLRYYGEMITYLGMSMPIALFSVISWLKHPYAKNRNEVKIHKLSRYETVLMLLATVAVTFAFHFLLKALDNAQLAVSTLSVSTSFLASVLLLFRNPYYALVYAANDIVLIILWIVASFVSVSNFPMVICFVMFLVNDIYGFISWKKRQLKQTE